MYYILIMFQQTLGCERSYLEDGVHDHRQRAVSGEFCYLENIQTPNINVLDLLEKENRTSMRHRAFLCVCFSVCVCVCFLVCVCVWAHLCQQALVWYADSKARDAGGGYAGALCGLFHTNDLWHRPLLLLLLLRGWRMDLHVMLFLCNMHKQTSLSHLNIRLYLICSTLAPLSQCQSDRVWFKRVFTPSLWNNCSKLRDLKSLLVFFNIWPLLKLNKI